MIEYVNELFDVNYYEKRPILSLDPKILKLANVVNDYTEYSIT